MSQRKIILDGLTFIRSRDAARIVQLAPDYISRLARAALIDGRLINGLWFVECASLEEFIADQERQKEIWRAQLARQRKKNSASPAIHRRMPQPDMPPRNELNARFRSQRLCTSCARQ